MKSKFTLSIIAISLLLTACQTIQVDTPSSVAVPDHFEQAKGSSRQAEISHWWQNWHDPQLSQLIEQGIANNFDIKQAQTKLLEMQAGTDYAETDLGINVGGQGSAGVGLSKMKMAGYNQNGQPRNTFGSIQASWEPDFFGQKQTEVDAAHFSQLSAQQQLNVTQTLVAAQIAQDYMNFYALRQQKAILDQQINQLKKMQTYVQGRFNAGQASRFDLNQIASQITATQAQGATLIAKPINSNAILRYLRGKRRKGFILIRKLIP